MGIKHPVLLRLKEETNYRFAAEFLESLLRKEIPAESIISKLYGAHRIRLVNEMIENFLTKNTFTGKHPRKSLDPVTEIQQKRIELEKNLDYQNLQTKLLLGKLPELSDFKPIYGGYSSEVRRVFELFNINNLKRKCGVPAVAHLNRVASLIWAIHMDTGENFHYIATAAFHDSIEDLLNVIKDDTGMKFSVDRLDDFLTFLVPEELRRSVLMLTNIYDLILTRIATELRNEDKAFRQENILLKIDEMMSSTNRPSIPVYMKIMRDTLLNTVIEEDILQEAKWVCYKNLYINQLADYTKEIKDFRLYQIKAVDLSDNAHGREALSLEGRIKNIIKLGIWADAGFNMHSTWEPLNNYIMEVHSEALTHSRYLVIKDLLEPHSSLDFLYSSLMKIKQLESIFFVENPYN